MEKKTDRKENESLQPANNETRELLSNDVELTGTERLLDLEEDDTNNDEEEEQTAS